LSRPVCRFPVQRLTCEAQSTHYLVPAPCWICGTILTTATICRICLYGFDLITEPTCRNCGRPFVSPLAADAVPPLWRLCSSRFYSFDRAQRYAVGVKRLGDWSAGRLAEMVQRGPQAWRDDVVVPVPLHADRLRERGSNQAELIARPLAKHLNLEFDAYLLVRTKPRPLRLVLSGTEPWTSVRGAYATRDGLAVDNLRILLVDDVWGHGRPRWTRASGP